MTTPSKTQQEALNELKASLRKISDVELANFACLFDLLGEHHVINDHNLSGAVSAIKADFMRAWNNLDNIIDTIPSVSTSGAVPDGIAR